MAPGWPWVAFLAHPWHRLECAARFPHQPRGRVRNAGFPPPCVPPILCSHRSGFGLFWVAFVPAIAPASPPIVPSSRELGAHHGVFRVFLAPFFIDTLNN